MLCFLLVLFVFNSVCELFSETIHNMFGCVCYFYLFTCMSVLNMISPLFYVLNFSKILVVDCDYVKNISESTYLN